MPVSAEMTIPPVRIAISWSISFRRSPKPGALTQQTFRAPRRLLTIRVDSASASTSASSSQSVAKVIDIDEEVVKIAGIGILILLIIAVIALYYRNDIKSMIEKKNGK